MVTTAVIGGNLVFTIRIFERLKFFIGTLILTGIGRPYFPQYRKANINKVKP